MIPTKAEIKIKSKGWDDSMDIYAKEIAIGFHKWINSQSYHYDYRGQEFSRTSDPKHYTHEELFQSYLNTLIQ